MNDFAIMNTCAKINALTEHTTYTMTCYQSTLTYKDMRTCVF